MSYKRNETQQMTMFDSMFGLTAREQKALEHSWAKTFSEEIFPAIDEDRFSVLYSENASRPNTPVNVIIGALILKELFDLSDDEVVENLMLDFRYQYALHTTSFEEQPLSDKSLTRFRQRCYDYEQVQGKDLLHGCVTDLAAKIAKLMKIDGRIRRMDSLMVEANIRKLSRMELLYRCVSKLVIYLKNNGFEDRIFPMDHYTEPDDFNRFIYHSRSTETDERIAILLNDSDTLLSRCDDLEDVTEYQLLLRCVSEQTIVENGSRRLKTKKDGLLGSSILQSPVDPDATYREKAGKAHRGYSANFEEAVGKNGSVVMDYQFESNNASDSALLKDRLEKLDPMQEPVVLVTDGAYCGTGNTELAASKNIELVTTTLTGRKTDVVMGAFAFNEDGSKVLACPAGHQPKSCTYIKQSGMCQISFDREICAGCPYQQHCHPKVFKRVSKVTVSKTMRERARMQARMNTERFKYLARIRNGAETIPSLLKNEYGVNQMLVHGKTRCKFFFGCKIAAINFRKLFGFRKGLGHYAPNPVLS